jgi:hypothetical protein
MSKFIKLFLLFILPFVIILAILIYLDIFKAFWNYDDYYKGTFVEVNREWVCTKTYLKYRETEHFDSFIFGSSRSQSFKCNEWEKYLPIGAKSFHFDGAGDGLYGVTNKIKYLDELGDTIANALVIVDRGFLRILKNKTEHMGISPPCLSKESKLKFYVTFIKAVNVKFLRAYIDYSIFKKHRPYMGFLIRNPKYPHQVDKVNCNIVYGYDQQIEEDSLGYYKELIEKGVFYERPQNNMSKTLVTEKEKEFLNSMKTIFDKHQTNYKIVISPIYDQVPMEIEQLDLLNDIFGKEHIYNFSGKNDLTEPISNYYESSHFRTHVANKILKIIYTDSF